MASCKVFVAVLAVLCLATGLATGARVERSLKEMKCTPTVVKIAALGAKAPCTAQVVKGVVVTPKALKDSYATADAACARLGLGKAVTTSIKWTAKPQTCFDGKASKTGIAFASLSCCGAGAATARARETAAESGTSIGQSEFFGH